jgi:parallel beta-helix repeat protein
MSSSTRRNNPTIPLAIVAAILGLLCASSTKGATLNVPSAEYPTIQAAINVAQNGDTVEVAPGTYYENLSWIAKSIYLIGAGADATIIHGDGTNWCLLMQNVPNSARIEGFTFTGGAGGISLYSSSPTLFENIITGNSGNQGGGLRLDNSSPVLESNTISSNTALYGGGGLNVRNASAPTLIGNEISGNSGWGSGNGGGGLYIYYASGTLVNNSITGNSSNNGGGLSIEHSSPTLTDNLITDNSATLNGGGVSMYGGAPVLMGNSISNNIAITGNGGGIRTISGSLPALINNSITGNTAGNEGGGVCSGDDFADFTGNYISGNSAQNGGGLSIVAPTAIFANNTITGNSATYEGGGIRVTWYSTATLTNNVIAGNSASQGGGVYLAWYSCPTLTNNTIASNSGGGLYNDTVHPGNPIITNSIFWANGDYDLDGAPLAPTYSDIGVGFIGGPGNISVDPLFVRSPDDGGDGWGDDPTTPDVDEGANDDFGDLHLRGTSLCIDAGSNSAPGLPGTDKEGNPRIMGSAVDIGAYETLATTVIIDIKPGSYPNAINLGSEGLIPVAILRSGQFDPSNVDVETVALAGSGVAVRGKGNRYMSHEEDVNGDGLTDLVVQVEAENLNPENVQEGFAVLTGQTNDGTHIEGMDEIILVPLGQ